MNAGVVLFGLILGIAFGMISLWLFNEQIMGFMDDVHEKVQSWVKRG